MRGLCSPLIIIFCILSFLNSTLAAPSSSEDVNLGVKVVDHIPPANVSNFTATPGDQHITLSWTNPSESDFSGVRIQRSTFYYPIAPNAGDNVYDGVGTAHIDQNLTNGVRYYYTAFSYDTSGNYASGALATAIPAAPSLVQPQEEAKLILPTEPAEAAAPVKKEKIEIADFHFFVLFDKGPLEIDLDELGQVIVVKGISMMVTISADIFAKEVNVITVTLAGSSYLLQRVENRFQTVISAPPADGKYDINFIIVYKDDTITTIQNKVWVNSYGYVYEKQFSFFGLGNSEETRIAGAKITLYYLNKNKWEKWPASDYNQDNPLITDKTGEFVFFVPDGKYYLETEKAGFLKNKTAPFEIKSQVINKDIELIPLIRAWVWLAIVGIIILALAIWIWLRIRKKRRA